MYGETLELYDSLKNYIINLESGINKIIEKIHTGNENEFLSMIVDAVDGIDWTIKAIYLTQNHHDIKEVDKLNNILQEAINGLENNDYIFVADIFEYEVLPEVELWKNKICGEACV